MHTKAKYHKPSNTWMAPASEGYDRAESIASCTNPKARAELQKKLDEHMKRLDQEAKRRGEVF